MTGVGIFGGVLNVTPAVSRWLTTTELMAFLVAGMLTHMLLPRAWRLAFGEWYIPANVEVNDYSKMVRSKAYRAKLWLSSVHVDIRTSVHCIVAEPGEHLLLQLQHLERQGGALSLLCGLEGNPVLACLQQYAAMFTKPLETNLAVLCRHFETLDDGDYAVFVDAVRSAALSVAVRIWRYIFVLFLSWPYKLASLVHADPDVRDAAAHALENARECCLDRAMSRKAQKLLHTQRRRALLTALRAWVRGTLVTNMVTERLLSLIRKSAEKKVCAATSTIGRLSHAGTICAPPGRWRRRPQNHTCEVDAHGRAYPCRQGQTWYHGEVQGQQKTACFSYMV